MSVPDDQSKRRDEAIPPHRTPPRLSRAVGSPGADVARRSVILITGALTITLFASLAPGCRRDDPKRVTAPVAATAAMSHASSDCRSCHEDIYKTWADSHHAHAHRVVNPVADADAFTPKKFPLHGVNYELALENGRPALTELRPDRPPQRFTADYVLGYTPLRQYVVPVGNGRYQLTELAYDPAKNDWFNVFGDERRQPGEWGQWLGRGMNWNSMCAHCHLTEFRKNYNPATDAYASTWTEHGVGCVQCHGNLAPNHSDPNRKPIVRSSGAQPTEPKPPAVLAAVRQRAQETCAPCHARNELLTGDVRPEVAYNDHYRLTLPTDAAVFYPDGQVRDEDFNYTSLMTSRMGGKAGITCLDCHEPHSGRTRLPASNNALCLQCHGAPGRQNAVIIDPLAHSHHKADSTGNQCVTCHMPMTTYMQRDPRHDHGFLKPDPLLTRELGIPNACNRCHTDQTVDWSITHTEQWYGEKMNSRQRARARAVAAAQTGAAGATERLLEFIASEDIPAWKATLLLLTRAHAANPAVIAAARAATTDADPMVRSAAAQVLATSPGGAPALRPLLKDPFRLVRLDAEWALSPELPENSPERKELEAYLTVAADQPTGRLRIAQDLFNRGRTADAEAPLRKATEWDPNSPGIHETLGLVLDALGRSGEAAASLWRSAQLNPTEAQPAMNAALAFAAAGKLPDAELALREAVRRDPRLDRAWYNLGLLLAQTNRPAEAITALQQAEQIAPRVPDYPYARATILWQRGEREAAEAAARRVLEIDPSHANARQLLRSPR
ncbi:MAG: tetratricopeptide repeat protein [Opitutaceae bacterium]|nr:tetratricopeptide repeat protein [Opitutaceae bacterium]